MSTVLLLMRVEYGLRSRKSWTLGALSILAALSMALLYASVGVAAQAGFGPSAGALININMLVVPLVALMLGALTVVRDRERGTLAYLCVQPVTMAQVFWSKWLSLVLQLASIVCGTFVALLLGLAVMHVPHEIGAMVQFMLATLLLAVAMGSCGMCLSIVARSTPIALAGALAVWLFFVVFADVGVMAGALATHMSTQTLLALTSANPIEAYKIASLCALSGSVDVLGPGGRLATDVFGTSLMPFMIAILVAWAAGATVLGCWALGRNLRA